MIGCAGHGFPGVQPLSFWLLPSAGIFHQVFIATGGGLRRR